jgi:hypothetical protein
MTRIMLGDNIDEILEECGNYKDFQLGGQRPLYRAQLLGEYTDVPVPQGQYRQ